MKKLLMIRFALPLMSLYIRTLRRRINVNKVLRILYGYPLIVLMMLIGTPAKAIQISVVSFFNPQNNTASTTIFAEGLGGHAAPSLGAFDINFQFDPNVLALHSVLFGPLLGSPDNLRFSNTSGNLIPDRMGAGEAITGASLVSSGSVDLFEVSLLEASQSTCVFCIGPFLDDMQPSRFALLFLSFDGVDPLNPLPNVNRGRMGFNLSINGNALSDAYGNPLTVSSISFTPASSPSTMALFGIGLLALIWKRSAGRRFRMRF